MLSLSQMLARNQSLQQLGLSKHGMVDSQLNTLVTYGLLRNTTLTSLDLKANRLSAFAGERKGSIHSVLYSPWGRRRGRTRHLPKAGSTSFCRSILEQHKDSWCQRRNGRTVSCSTGQAASWLTRHLLYYYAQPPPRSPLAHVALAYAAKRRAHDIHL